MQWIQLGGLIVGIAGILVAIGVGKQKIKQNEERTKDNEKQIGEHITSCNARHVESARLEEKVSHIVEKQADMVITISRMDGKIDRLLERP